MLEKGFTDSDSILPEFLRTSLVLPNQDVFDHSPPSPTSIYSDSNQSLVQKVSLPFDGAAEAIRSLTQGDASVIIDLRNFNAPHAPSGLSAVSSHNAIDDYVIKDTSSTPPPNVATRHSRNSSVRSTDLNGSSLPFQVNDAQRRGGIFCGLAPGAGCILVAGSSGGESSSFLETEDAKTCISNFLEKFYIVSLPVLSYKSLVYLTDMKSFISHRKDLVDTIIVIAISLALP